MCFVWFTFGELMVGCLCVCYLLKLLCWWVVNMLFVLIHFVFGYFDFVFCLLFI